MIAPLLAPFPALLLSLSCGSQGCRSSSPTDTSVVQPPGGRPDTPPDPLVTRRCPAAPADALTFHTGSIVAQQSFVRDGNGSLGRGYVLLATGLSYIDSVECKDWHAYTDQDWKFPVKRGERTGEYLFELALTVPGDELQDYLGLHDDGGAFLFNPDFAANQVQIGWHDGEDYHWVETLPQGWTDTKVCIDSLTADHIRATVLFDPLEGPYSRNERNLLLQPIWFELEAWATGDDLSKTKHSCYSTVWYPGTSEESMFGDEE